MPCYRCTKCNQCGRYSYFMKLLCNTCEAEIPIGADVCPVCGESTIGNTHTGEVEFDAAMPVRNLDNPLPV